MSEEKRLLAAFTPEVDGVRQRVNGLLVAADERAAKVDAFEVVFFGLQVGDLADVVTVGKVRVSTQLNFRVLRFHVLWFHVSWFREALPYRV